MKLNRTAKRLIALALINVLFVGAGYMIGHDTYYEGSIEIQVDSYTLDGSVAPATYICTDVCPHDHDACPGKTADVCAVDVSERHRLPHYASASEFAREYAITFGVFFGLISVLVMLLYSVMRLGGMARSLLVRKMVSG